MQRLKLSTISSRAMRNQKYAHSPTTTKGSPEYEALPEVSADNLPLKFMKEVYVDDYISLAMAWSKQDLGHIANATMHGMHSVFPASAVDSKDPISEKKMIDKDGQWRVRRDVFGSTFDRVGKKNYGVREGKS